MTPTEFTIEDRSVEGDIVRRTKSNVPQSTPAEFLEFIDKALATPGIAALGWTQYTPYFNDGEPCEFSVHDLNVKLDPEVFGDEIEDDEDAYDLPEGEGWQTEYGLKSYIDPTLSYPRRYDDSNIRYEINGVSTKPVIEVLKGWKSSAFESVCLENFGDHATVIATPEGFSVEFNEHE